MKLRQFESKTDLGLFLYTSISRGVAAVAGAAGVYKTLEDRVADLEALLREMYPIGVLACSHCNAQAQTLRDAVQGLVSEMDKLRVDSFAALQETAEMFELFKAVLAAPGSGQDQARFSTLYERAGALAAEARTLTLFFAIGPGSKPHT
jgi:hypothetical protein